MRWWLWLLSMHQVKVQSVSVVCVYKQNRAHDLLMITRQSVPVPALVHRSAQVTPAQSASPVNTCNKTCPQSFLIVFSFDCWLTLTDWIQIPTFLQPPPNKTKLSFPLVAETHESKIFYSTPKSVTKTAIKLSLLMYEVTKLGTWSLCNYWESNAGYIFVRNYYILIWISPLVPPGGNVIWQQQVSEH